MGKREASRSLQSLNYCGRENKGTACSLLKVLLHCAFFPATCNATASSWTIARCNRVYLGNQCNACFRLLRATLHEVVSSSIFRNNRSNLQPLLHSVTPLQQLQQRNSSRAHASFFVNQTDRRPRRATCEFPQPFLPQMVASSSDRVAQCNIKFLPLKRKQFSTLQVAEKIANCNSAFNWRWNILSTKTVCRYIENVQKYVDRKKMRITWERLTQRTMEMGVFRTKEAGLMWGRAMHNGRQWAFNMLTFSQRQQLRVDWDRCRSFITETCVWAWRSRLQKKGTRISLHTASYHMEETVYPTRWSLS